LRPYQQQGLNWLQFLREHRLAGILADEGYAVRTAPDADAALAVWTDLRAGGLEPVRP
jgi:hypothetical protein